MVESSFKLLVSIIIPIILIITGYSMINHCDGTIIWFYIGFGLLISSWVDERIKKRPIPQSATIRASHDNIHFYVDNEILWKAVVNNGQIDRIKLSITSVKTILIDDKRAWILTTTGYLHTILLTDSLEKIAIRDRTITYLDRQSNDNLYIICQDGTILVRDMACDIDQLLARCADSKVDPSIVRQFGIDDNGELWTVGEGRIVKRLHLN